MQEMNKLHTIDLIDLIGVPKRRRYRHRRLRWNELATPFHVHSSFHYPFQG